jgi:hypothetical protein
MNARFLAIVLVGTSLLFASSAHATSVRSGSGYGMGVLSDGFTTVPGVTGGMEEWFACVGTTGFTPAGGCVGGDGYDLILQITDSTYANDSLQINIPNLTTTPLLSGTPAFGLLSCDTGDPDGLDPTLCPSASVPSPTASCNSAFPTSAVGAMNTITLPSSCVVVGATFYFDEEASNIVNATTNALAVTPAVVTPEPSSLALFGLVLIPLLLFSKRRVQA